jgi:hypothetical protein
MNKRLVPSPKKQSRRVAAWIYAVINPVISSLERELALLESADLTWRAYTGRCEIVRTIQEYVEPTQWPNYQDFVAEHSNSPLIPKFEQHDSELLKLESAAHLLFERLLSSEQFLVAVQGAADIYESQRATLGPHASALTHSLDEVAKLVAEYLINNVRSLPSHYVISAFWNFANKSLFGFRSLPEFQPLIRSENRLKEVSAQLEVALESFRLSLSRDYDVPASPVPGISLEE